MSRCRWILLALFVAGLAQMAWYFPRMPVLLSSHFGASGAANGSMSRGAALGFHLAVLGTLAVLFAVLPAVLTRLDPRFINLPHRDYWLAPERRAETLSWLRGRMECMGCATMAFLLSIMELVFRANLRPPPRLPMELFWACLGGFLVFSVISMVTFMRHFRRPPEK